MVDVVPAVDVVLVERVGVVDVVTAVDVVLVERVGVVDVVVAIVVVVDSTDSKHKNI